MSNYEKRTCLNGRVHYGPEDTNGTGQVYLDLDMLPRWLSQHDVRQLAHALLEAAEDAQRNQWKIEERMYAPKEG